MNDDNDGEMQVRTSLWHNELCAWRWCSLGTGRVQERCSGCMEVLGGIHFSREQCTLSQREQEMKKARDKGRMKRRMMFFCQWVPLYSNHMRVSTYLEWRVYFSTKMHSGSSGLRSILCGILYLCRAQ